MAPQHHVSGDEQDEEERQQHEGCRGAVGLQEFGALLPVGLPEDLDDRCRAEGSEPELEETLGIGGRAEDEQQGRDVDIAEDPAHGRLLARGSLPAEQQERGREDIGTEEREQQGQNQIPPDEEGHLAADGVEDVGECGDEGREEEESGILADRAQQSRKSAADLFGPTAQVSQLHALRGTTS